VEEEERRELEHREMQKLGEDLEASCASVQGSLQLLLRGLRDFEEWRNVITANHVLPTNVLQQVAVIGSQVRGCGVWHSDEVTESCA
jgi:hypothetical protein